MAKTNGPERRRTASRVIIESFRRVTAAACVLHLTLSAGVGSANCPSFPAVPRPISARGSMATASPGRAGSTLQLAAHLCYCLTACCHATRHVGRTDNRPAPLCRFAPLQIHRALHSGMAGIEGSHQALSSALHSIKSIRWPLVQLSPPVGWLPEVINTAGSTSQRTPHVEYRCLAGAEQPSVDRWTALALAHAHKCDPAGGLKGGRHRREGGGPRW